VLGAPSAARVGERSNGSINVHEPKDAAFVLTRANSRGSALSEKKRFAPAQQDRVDEQQHLVDQSLLEQHGRQRGTSTDDLVRAVL
jgi:hypothetical protein